jgi:hypothetical protein
MYPCTEAWFLIFISANGASLIMKVEVKCTDSADPCIIVSLPDC